VSGSDEGRELKACASVGRSEHDDLRSRVGDRNDRVEEFAFHERLSFDLEPEPHEEGRRGGEIGHRDADMIEAPYSWHEVSSV
jgi:hypothetical protein